MNTINFNLDIIPENTVRKLDGINFTSTAFIRSEIDGEDILSSNEFEGSAICISELLNSINGSGEYLIFTCICGIAEDAGWIPIEVIHDNGLIHWRFEREQPHRYSFNLEQYKAAIHSCQIAIDALPSSYSIQPK